VCVLVWLAEVLVPGLVYDLAFVPAKGRHEPWSWVTSAFTHDDALPIHIGSNMLALWMLGTIMESTLGRWRYLGLYGLSAVGGTLAYLWWALPPTAAAPLGRDWNTELVGASGAVFGLFGGLLVVQRRLRRPTTQIWVLLAINAVISFTVPGIAWQAHVGGFVTGLVTTALLVRLLSRPRVEVAREGATVQMTARPRPTWPVMVVVLAVLVAGTALRYAVL